MHSLKKTNTQSVKIHWNKRFLVGAVCDVWEVLFLSLNLSLNSMFWLPCSTLKNQLWVFFSAKLKLICYFFISYVWELDKNKPTRNGSMIKLCYFFTKPKQYSLGSKNAIVHQKQPRLFLEMKISNLFTVNKIFLFEGSTG